VAARLRHGDEPWPGVLHVGTCIDIDASCITFPCPVRGIYSSSVCLRVRGDKLAMRCTRFIFYSSS